MGISRKDLIEGINELYEEKAEYAARLSAYEKVKGEESVLLTEAKIALGEKAFPKSRLAAFPVAKGSGKAQSYKHWFEKLTMDAVDDDCRWLLNECSFKGLARYLDPWLQKAFREMKGESKEEQKDE